MMSTETKEEQTGRLLLGASGDTGLQYAVSSLAPPSHTGLQYQVSSLSPINNTGLQHQISLVPSGDTGLQHQVYSLAPSGDSGLHQVSSQVPINNTGLQPQVYSPAPVRNTVYSPAPVSNTGLQQQVSSPAPPGDTGLHQFSSLAPVSNTGLQYQVSQAPVSNTGLQYQVSQAPVSNTGLQYQVSQAPVSNTGLQYQVSQAPVSNTGLQHQVYSLAPPGDTGLHQVSSLAPVSDTGQQHQVYSVAPLNNTGLQHQVSLQAAVSNTELQHQVYSVAPIDNTGLQHQVSSPAPLDNTGLQHQVYTSPPVNNTGLQHQVSSPAPLDNTVLQHQVSSSLAPPGDTGLHQVSSQVPLDNTGLQHQVYSQAIPGDTGLQHQVSSSQAPPGDTGLHQISSPAPLNNTGLQHQVSSLAPPGDTGLQHQVSSVVPPGYAELQHEVSSLRTKVGELEGQLSTVRTELATIHDKISQLDTKYTDSLRTENELLKENRDLREELKKMSQTPSSNVNNKDSGEKQSSGVQSVATENSVKHKKQTTSLMAHEFDFNAHQKSETNAEGGEKVGELGKDGMPVWNIKQEGGKETSGGEPKVSIAEGLAAAANEVLQESGMTYDEASGMYYDPSSGYYVNPERSLYYEPHSGTYYVYDHEKREYKFHSQVNVNQRYSDYHGAQSQQHGERKKDWRKDRDRSESSSRKRSQLIEDYVKYIRSHRERREIKDKLKRLLRDKDMSTLKMSDLSGLLEKADEKDRHRSDKRSHCAKESSSRDKRSEPNRRERSQRDEKDSSSTRRERKTRDTTSGSSKPSSDSVSGKPSSNSDNGKPSATDDKCSKPSDDKIGVDPHVSNNIEMGEDVLVNESSCLDSTSIDGEELIEDSAMEIINDEDDCQFDTESLLTVNLEEGELSESLSVMSDPSSLSLSYSEESDMDIDDRVRKRPKNQHEEDQSAEDEEESVALHFAPCIRAMVIASDTLDEAKLFIITCTGGSIGRDPTLKHNITIPDVNVSKAHVELSYRQDVKKYTVRDLASQNGTFVNGHRLSESKEMSEVYPLANRDTLTVGGTTLDLHIHPGTDTCDECEPGLALARIREKEKNEVTILSKEDKEQIRRQQLRQIKKKFGLENMSYIENKGALSNPAYQDKAEERRRTKGSDNPYQADDLPASVDRPIAETNKGHQMLAKMGWKEGRGLGRAEQGRAEPVKAEIQSVGGSGLGAGPGAGMSFDNVTQRSKAAIRAAKTRGRYAQLQRLANEKKPGPLVLKTPTWVAAQSSSDEEETTEKQ